MMKIKLSRKFIAFFLVLSLLFVPSMLIVDAAEINKVYPTISVPGIMAADVYADVNNPDEGLAWPPSTDGILQLVKDCIPALLEFSVTRDWDKLGHTLSPLAYELFEKACCDPDGDITNGSGIIFEYPSVEELQENPDSTFYYDWRADPVKTAAELNDYIDYVLSATGAEKVAIQCHSLGGVITVSYCSIYGHDKIDAIAFNSSAVYGESYTGDLLCGDIVLSNDSLMSFMDFVFDATEQEELLTKIFDVLEAAGLGTFVADLGNELLANLSDILIPEVVVPVFGRWLTIWAMVPDDRIDEAIDYAYDNYFPEGTEGREELLVKIEAYNELVRCKKTETLLEIDKDCKVGVICRYGYSSIPATSSWQEISDGVIDAKNASFGGTFALYGSKLDDSIIENTDEAYISPDKTADASTCLFPEKTWFIKGAKHSNGYDDLDSLVDHIINSDEEITVDTYEQFPRFMKYDYATNSIIADDGEDETVNHGIFSFFAKIKAFIADFMEKLRKFFGV